VVPKEIPLLTQIRPRCSMRGLSQFTSHLEEYVKDCCQLVISSSNGGPVLSTARRTCALRHATVGHHQANKKR
jgi:hypothetical protein